MDMLARLRGMRTDDSGIGMVTVIFVIAVVSALTLTAVTVTMNNFRNTTSDRQSLAALASSEAGVAQTVSRLRSVNLSTLTCIEPPAGTAPGPTCQGATQSWTSAANPMQIRLDGAAGGCTATVDCFRVWIGTVRPYVANCAGRMANPPRPCTGLYRVHSTGVSRSGQGARQVAVDVEVQPYPFPMGVFAESFAGSGGVGVHQQSLFTNGCVQNRTSDAAGGSGVRFAWDSAAGRPVLDLVYGIPTAAHATGDISTANNTCGTGSGGGPIHKTDQPPCNSVYRFDQSGSGGTLASGDGCHGAYTSGSTVYPTTSAFSTADMSRLYGYRPRGLTDTQYNALRTQAQSQGTYNIATTDIAARLSALSAQGISSPVLYWDSGSVSLKQSDFPADYSRAYPNNDPACNLKSVTIVVVGTGNNLAYQGGNTSPYLVASIFVPDGQLSGSGGRNTIGTVFARQLDLGGGSQFFMDSCYANNPPGATIDAQIVDWREDDARDLN